MKKLAIILQQNIAITLSQLDQKACSGTIYATLLLAEALTDTYEVTIFHQGHTCSDQDLKFITIEDDESLVKSINSNFDVLIAVGSAGNLFKKYNFKCKRKIFWLHNHENLASYKTLISEKRLDKIVTVCAYQLAASLRSNLFFRTTYIYNPYKLPIIEPVIRDKNGPLKLAFSGALVEEKGIGNVFVIYRKLLNAGFDVELNIFGSSNLYGNEAKCGRISELSYEIEKKYEKYIFDDKQNLVNGLNFHGALGKYELINKLKQCHVFISGLNEVGAAECFSISFLDAQACSVKVLSLNRGGQAESILSKESGKVFNSLDHVYKYISLNYDQLKHTSFELSNEFQALSQDAISKQWIEVIEHDKIQIRKHLWSIFRMLTTITSSFFRRLSTVKVNN